MSYIKKINNVIYDAMDVGIKNLKLAGYHIDSYGISIMESKFWVEIEGDCVDELEKVNGSSFIKISTVVSNTPGDRNTSIDCKLTAIDAFINFTKALLAAKKIERRALMFEPAVQSIADKVGIRVTMENNIDNDTICIKITVPVLYSLSVDSRLELNEVGTKPAMSISYSDHTSYTLDMANEDGTKLRFILWLSKLPAVSTRSMHAEGAGFRNKSREILESKGCGVMYTGSNGVSGLYQVTFICRNKDIEKTVLEHYDPLYCVRVDHDPVDGIAIDILFGSEHMPKSIDAVLKLLESLPMDKPSKKLDEHDIM